MTTGMFYVDVFLHVGVVGPLVFSDNVCLMCDGVGLCRLVELLLGWDTFVVMDGVASMLYVALVSLPGPDLLLLLGCGVALGVR